MIHGQVFDALSIQVDFAMFFARQAFQQFGEGAFRAMAAVNEW